jgi:hypothetical protein
MDKNINRELRTYFNCSIRICGSSRKERSEGSSAQVQLQYWNMKLAMGLLFFLELQVLRGVQAVGPSFGA